MALPLSLLLFFVRFLPKNIVLLVQQLAYKLEEKQVDFNFHWFDRVAARGGSWMTAQGAAAAGVYVPPQGVAVLPPVLQDVVACEGRIVDVRVYFITFEIN